MTASSTGEPVIGKLGVAMYRGESPDAVGQSALRGTSAAACSNETVSLPGGRMTLRFVLHGSVSCSEAHATMRAYARALVAGHCPTRICDMTFPGGWICSSTSAVEQQMSGGILGGCQRRGASFDIYKARGAKPGDGGAGSWHMVSRHAAFPVYRPRETPGLPLLESAHLPLNRFLKVARSFTRVR